MNENQAFEKAVNVMTDEPTKVSINHKQPTLLDRLMIWLKLKPASYDFTVRPITVGNFKRIRVAINSIPDDIFQNGLLNGMLQLNPMHIDHYIYVVAVGLLNQRDEPSRAFLELLSHELQWEQVSFLIGKIMEMVGVEHFMNSTILIKGTKVLMMGPETSGEIIAQQTPGEI